MGRERAFIGCAPVFILLLAEMGFRMEETVLEPGLSDSQLIEAARKNLVGAVAAATSALAEQASKGSAAHIKLLLQLVGLDDGALASRETRPKEKTLQEILEEQWANTP
jgi:hypothetical protein